MVYASKIFLQQCPNTVILHSKFDIIKHLNLNRNLRKHGFFKPLLQDRISNNIVPSQTLGLHGL